MTRAPQLIVTLLPSGALAAELPGPFATRRKVEMTDSEVATTVRRILEAQSHDRTEIGLDGAPTNAQVLHWEKHQQFASARCRFCLAEGRIKPAAEKRRRSEKIDLGGGIVMIKKAPSGASGIKGKASLATKTASELDL